MERQGSQDASGFGDQRWSTPSAGHSGYPGPDHSGYYDPPGDDPYSYPGYGGSHLPGSYGAADSGPPGYGPPQYGPPGPPQYGPPGPPQYGPPGPPEYGPPGYGPPGYGPPQYGPGDPAPPGYPGAVGRAQVPVPNPVPQEAAPPSVTPSAPPAARPPRRRRRGLIAALVVLVLLIAGGSAVVLLRPGLLGLRSLTAQPAARATVPAEPEPSPVLAAAEDAPVPALAAVRAALDPLVQNRALGQVRVAVRDIATGQPLYERGAHAASVPASTTKLVTALTVLAARGPAYRIPTRVVRGTAAGEVVLVGGGDPSLAVNARSTYPGAARLDQLAAAVKRALGGVRPTSVTVDTSLFPGPVLGPGWDADVPTGGFGAPITALMTNGARVRPVYANVPSPRSAQPDVAAGQAFARLLGLPPSAVHLSRRPATGAELARVESPPLLQLVDVMLAYSDNIIAEMLARQVALARGLPGSFAGVPTAVRAQLAELGVPTAEFGLVDGSGLSRADRLSATLLTQVIQASASGRAPQTSELISGLPVGGWSGTLAWRFRKPPAVTGLVRAKTGSLTGVDAIAGIVLTAHGRVVAFAVIANGVPSGHSVAQSGLDRIPAALAAL